MTCSTATQPATAFGINLQTASGIILPSGVSTALYDMEFSFTQFGVSIGVGGIAVVNSTYDNAGSLAAVYDQYRIDRVDMEIFFSNNFSNVTTPSVTLPIMTIVEDYDDSNSITLAKANAYNNAVQWQLGQMRGSGSIHKSIKPTVDLLVYNGVTSGYARADPMFIDTANNAVPHYGIKLVIDPIVQTAASTVCGYLSFRFRAHMTYKASI